MVGRIRKLAKDVEFAYENLENAIDESYYHGYGLRMGLSPIKQMDLQTE